MSDEIVEFLYFVGDALPRPFETPYLYIRRLRNIERKDYYDRVRKLKRRGLVAIINQGGDRFIQLTQKGQLNILFAKASIKPMKRWDNNWRIVTFDVPESCRSERNQLRLLLKRNNFYKLQASVFISPYPLNREAISYLEQSGLIAYIRIVRIDEMDNDQSLRAHFGLK